MMWLKKWRRKRTVHVWRTPHHLLNTVGAIMCMAVWLCILLRFNQMLQNRLDSTRKCKWIMTSSMLPKTPRSLSVMVPLFSSANLPTRVFLSLHMLFLSVSPCVWSPCICVSRGAAVSWFLQMSLLEHLQPIHWLLTYCKKLPVLSLAHWHISSPFMW